MKVVVWKNHLGGQILHRSLDPFKKRRLVDFGIGISIELQLISAKIKPEKIILL